ncbi:MAG: SPOR domain-containing protein [Treponema sp.]|nr:SPOR domain-containing protein [Treponema sp.]
MEQKRTLWIVAAVGVFLLVVLGAAIILNSAAPKNEPAESAVQYSDEWLYPKSTTEENSINGIEYTTDASGQTAGQNGYVEYDTNGNPVVNSSNMENNSIEPLQPLATNTNKLDNNSNSTSQATESNNKTSDSSSEQTGNMTVYSTNTNIYSSSPVASNVQPTNAKTEKAMTETASTNANQKTTAATITPRPAVTNTTTTKTTSKPATTNYNKSTKKSNTLADQFWVQAASFTDKNRADSAREKLDSNKIQSEIFTYTDSNGKMYYRVRVGPYVTKSEAEYWQKRIAQVEGFTGSYVTNSSAAKK